MTAAADFSIRPLGDAALLVTSVAGGDAACEQINSWSAACERDRLPGVTDVVPAFATLGIHFDPSSVPVTSDASPFEAVVHWFTKRCQNSTSLADRDESRLIELPVCYGGEHGPDLADLATGAGIDVDEVVRRHSETTYRVGAVGFAPGFAYLEGLLAELHTPRKATPRTRVPTGSVAIGGRYTGVYPQESPGGWHVIGRTATRLFDVDATPPSLLRSGDRVRFRPVDKIEPQANETSAATAATEGTPVFRVVSPGVQTTLQDLGRTGWQAIGVSLSGAMDRRSLQLANTLASASANSTAIEATLAGPVLEALADTTIGLAGALPRRIGVPQRVRLRAGQRLDLRELVGGARCYVAVAGGIACQPTLGSRATDLRAGFGGFAGRALAEGDVLLAGSTNATPVLVTPLAAAPTTIADVRVELRVLAGPQASWFDADSTHRFFASEYRITPQSSRMGLRCDGPALQANQRELESQPVTFGAIQVPPDGKPVVLGADRQTLGGYPVIGCVITADLPRLGQLAPGDRVRFRRVDLDEAERLRTDADRWLAIAAAGIRMRDEGP